MLKALVLAVPLALAVTACSGGATSSGSDVKAVSSDGTIVIGATLSLTGSLAGYGSPLKAGYEQEIADVNAAGGTSVGGTREKLKLKS